MNPLAQLMRSRGHAVQGSDRSFDQGKNLDVADRLTELGIVVKPQDGSAVSPNLDRFVYSTAVEAETPEVRAARSYGIERVPRPALLAEVGRGVGARTYGVDPGADARLEVTSVGPHRASGVLHVPGGSLGLEVPQPGRHNLENAAAAALIALELGFAPATVAALLARFPGVARRFEVIAVTAGGIRVVDDYAHNGEKLRAAITTAQSGAARGLAVFQPHGFGPARFLRPERRELMPRLLRTQDRLCYAEVFYSVGTVARDVSG